MNQIPARVKIREVGPRDGFQIQKEFIPTEEKLEVIRAIAAAGASDIEATAFVNPVAVPQMRDAAEIMARVPRKGTRYSAIAPNFRGARDAISAGVDELVVFISASNAHNRANVRRTVDESIADLDATMALAGEKRVPVIGSIATAFGCPYQGDVSDAEILKLADAYMVRGVKTLLLADTTGMASPLRIENTIKVVQDRHPQAELVLHLHNNRGTAMANLLTAMLCGVATFDTSLGGLGGCPFVPQAAGNLPTEDVVFMLEDMGVVTGIDLEALILAARRLEEIVGKPLPGQVMKSGPRDPKRAAELCGVSH